MRTRNFTPALNLEGCDALRLRVKGDGQRYKLSVRTDTNWDGVGYTQYTPASKTSQQQSAEAYHFCSYFC